MKCNSMASLSLPEFKERIRERRELPPPALRRELRRAAGVSVADVAAAIGVSRATVGFWERGEKSPTGANLSKYVEVLRVLRDEAAA